MQTKQLIVRSAVTVVATGLTLLSSGTSEAHGRGPSGMRMSGSRGGMNNGAIHQSTTNRALSRGRGVENAIGRDSGSQGLNRGRDDRGGHGEREHRGNDDRATSATAREREPGDDHGRHRERGDDKGGNASVTRGEREPGDDHGGRGEREPGDDHGGRR